MATPVFGTVTYQSQLDPIRPNKARCVTLRPAAGVDGIAAALGAIVPEQQRVRCRGQYTGAAVLARQTRDVILAQIGTSIRVTDCHGEYWSCFVIDVDVDYAESVFPNSFAVESRYTLLILDA